MPVTKLNDDSPGHNDDSPGHNDNSSVHNDDSPGHIGRRENRLEQVSIGIVDHSHDCLEALVTDRRTSLLRHISHQSLQNQQRHS